MIGNLVTLSSRFDGCRGASCVRLEHLVESASCEFLFDYEEEGEADGPDLSRSRRRKKRLWRYRWPDDDFRDEGLACPATH